jgi:hypothetical protein
MMGKAAEKILAKTCQQISQEYQFNLDVQYSKKGDLANYMARVTAESPD